MTTAAAIVALIASALTFGGMMFFSFVVAPMVFIKLPAEVAARFIRQLFPVYYLFGAGTAGVAALAFVPIDSASAARMLGVALASLLARQVLMPAINANRDRQLAGDAAAAKRFDRGHRASVILNAVQLLVVAWVLVDLASRWS